MREKPFHAQQVEQHPMLVGWKAEHAARLLGYVRTRRRPTAQTPLLTDRGEPLLAQWRVGRGKVTAFTSDAGGRWTRAWLRQPETYTRFWAQVLRDVARPPGAAPLQLSVQREPDGLRILLDRVSPGPAAGQDPITLEVALASPTALQAEAQVIGQTTLGGGHAARHEATFGASSPGLYVVRALTDQGIAEIPFARNPSGEAAAGGQDRGLLQALATLSHGAVLAPDRSLSLEAKPARVQRVELAAWMLRLFLPLFLLTLLIRRWPSAQGLYDRLRRFG